MPIFGGEVFYRAQCRDRPDDEKYSKHRAWQVLTIPRFYSEKWPISGNHGFLADPTYLYYYTVVRRDSRTTVKQNEPLGH